MIPKAVYSKIKIGYLPIFLILALFPHNAVYGLNYVLSEDFSDATLTDWDLIGESWEDFSITTSNSNHFVVKSGYLESQGSYVGSAWNVAIHDLDTAFGVWQFDVIYPSTRIVSEFDWYLGLVDNYYGGFGEQPTTFSSVERTKNGTMISIAQSRIEVRTLRIGTTGFPNEVILENQVPSQTWNHYDLVKTPNQFSIFINNRMVANFTYTDGIAKYNHMSLMTNSGSGLKFDNIRISLEYSEFLALISDKHDDISEQTNNVILRVAFVFIGIGAVVTIIYGYYKKKAVNKVIEIAHQSSNLSDHISPLFNSQPKLYYLLLGQTVKNEKERQKEIEDLIPQKIHQFRFLLHPYRLAVMKLLNEYYKLSSIEIKERLGLSWDEYSNTIKSLKKRGYISLSDDFEDSSVRKFVFLEEIGAQDYKSLSRLLEEFLYKTSDAFDGKDFDNLYPA